MIEHSQSHMLNNKIKICVGLAGKSYMLHPLERADFFFFSQCSYFHYGPWKNPTILVTCVYDMFLLWIDSLYCIVVSLDKIFTCFKTRETCSMWFEKNKEKQKKNWGSECHEENILQILKHLIRLQLEGFSKILATQEMSLGISSFYIYVVFFFFFFWSASLFIYYELFIGLGLDPLLQALWSPVTC